MTRACANSGGHEDAAESTYDACMLFSLLDVWDRAAELRDRFRGAWTLAIVCALLIGAWIAFLLLESLWETMTSRSTPTTTSADAAESQE